MNRSSLSQYFSNRGASPYTSYVGQYPERSVSELYDYIDEDHNVVDVDPYGRPPAPVFEDDDAPDMVHVRHMANLFSIEFPPFSIAEELVYVHHVRDRVAERLGVDPRRVRLVYKDRDLKKNHKPLRHYGCKQNSELSIVITNESFDYGGGHEGQSGSEGDGGSAVSTNIDRESKRPRSNSTFRKRSDDFVSTRASNGYLHPQAAHGGVAPPSGNLPRSATTREQRQTSPSRQQQQTSKSTPSVVSQRQASPKSSPTVIQPPTADPSTALGKVQAMRYEWQTKWEPECERFIDSPPSDTTERTKEYRKLSESVYKRLFEVGDAIEIGGDQEARETRKSLYKTAQDVLNTLDQFKA